MYFLSYRELPVGARQQGSIQKYLPERPAGSNSRVGRVRPKQRRALLDAPRVQPRDCAEPEVVPRILRPLSLWTEGVVFYITLGGIPNEII